MTPLPEVLTAHAVAARYGLRDLPAARKVMRAAGGFVVGGRLVVRVDDLDTYERHQADAARRAAVLPPTARRRTGRIGKRRPQAEKLAPGWWREVEAGL